MFRFYKDVDGTATNSDDLHIQRSKFMLENMRRGLILVLWLLQAQLLTLVEYILLLYRALIPGPVWYRFFLNKAYGNLFSSLTTGLYLTFKLTSNLEKVYLSFHCVF
jgi:hypothetical protein